MLLLFDIAKEISFIPFKCGFKTIKHMCTITNHTSLLLIVMINLT